MTLPSRARVLLAATAASAVMTIAGGTGAPAAGASPPPPDIGPCTTCGTSDVGSPGGVVPTDPPAAPPVDPPAAPPVEPPPPVDAVGGPSAAVVPHLKVVTVGDGRVPSSTVSEGDGSSHDVHVEFRLDRSTTVPVDADWSTVDSSAAAGQDYAAGSGHVRFDPGETTKTVTVSVQGDTTFENDESFLVAARNVSRAELVSPGYDRVTIMNDDQAPVLRFARYYDGALPLGSRYEGDSGWLDSWSEAVVFGLRLDQPSALPVEFDYTTVDGSATAGQDYKAMSGHLTIPPGGTIYGDAIPINGDTTYEPDEDFTIVASNPKNATLATTSSKVTLVNDDPRPNVGPLVDQRPDLGPVHLGVDYRGLTGQRRLRVALTCPAQTGGCRGKVLLRTGSRTVGHAAFSLAAGDGGVVTIALSSWARRQLAGHHRLGLVARIHPSTSTRPGDATYPGDPLAPSTSRVTVHWHGA
jgi:Calx-beta domain